MVCWGAEQTGWREDISQYDISWGKGMVLFFFFSFIFISWRLITLQYCCGFCHTLTWISHGFTCVSHPDPPSQRYGSSFKKSISQALSGEIRFKLNITRKGEKDRLWDLGKQQAKDEQQTGDFPGGPVVKPLHSQCRGHSFDPRAGLTKIPHATRGGQKEKKWVTGSDHQNSSVEVDCAGGFYSLQWWRWQTWVTWVALDCQTVVWLSFLSATLEQS